MDGSDALEAMKKLLQEEFQKREDALQRRLEDHEKTMDERRHRWEEERRKERELQVRERELRLRERELEFQQQVWESYGRDRELQWEGHRTERKYQQQQELLHMFMEGVNRYGVRGSSNQRTPVMSNDRDSRGNGGSGRQQAPALP